MPIQKKGEAMSDNGSLSIEGDGLQTLDGDGLPKSLDGEGLNPTDLLAWMIAKVILKMAPPQQRKQNKAQALCSPCSTQ